MRVAVICFGKTGMETALRLKDALQRTRPEWFVQDEMQHTSYEFQYEYLPDTIIHRLMIFCYQSHYYVHYRWRKGMSVDFGSDDTSRLTAVIDSGSDNRSITIEIYSDGRIPCWQFLSKLREEILQINEEINQLADDPTATGGGMVILLSIITCGIYGVYWAYRMGEKSDQIKGVNGSSAILMLILSLVGLQLINLALLQDTINRAI